MLHIGYIHLVRYQRRTLFLGLIALALVFAACGTSATLGMKSCASSTACYGVNYWVPKNHSFAGTPQGTMSQLFLRLLYCDTTCQSENGFIGDYILLGDANLQNWFELGYRADGANNGNMYYYAASQYGGAAVYTNMSPVSITSDIGSYLNFSVQHALDPTNTTSQNYIAQIFAAPNGAWSEDTFVNNTTSFTPGSVEIGEVVHGTMGESADTTVWLSDRYSTTAQYVYPQQSSFPNLFPNLTAKTGYGQMLLSSPPYGRWLNANVFDGDAFIAYCCLP